MIRLDDLSPDSRATFWRSLQTMNASRVAIALVLLLYLTVERGAARATPVVAYSGLCLLYLGLAASFGAISHRYRKRFLLQLMAYVAVDTVAISLLYVLAGGLRSGLVILYLFPLAGAAILAPLLLALFWAAVVTLVLLGDATFRALLDTSATPYLQSGLYGAAFFAAVLVVSRLAAKLIWQEELAVRRGVDLEIQEAINRIVIADMGDGVLVTDRAGRVFSANPAARRMLGLTRAASGLELGDAPSLAPLLAALRAWSTAPEGHQMAYVHLKPAAEPVADGSAAWTGRSDATSHLKLRFARPDTPLGERERCVIFLQDVTAIENQAQQLKLASMGRLTASIAHEVRNPLSAIGHATALLAEDLGDPAHVRLLRIVSDNVARVNRMVQDILQLSRKVQPNSEPLQLGPFLAEVRAEFVETHQIDAQTIALGAGAGHAVRFDQLHLREVVVNLLTNAVRYASATPGCIRIYVVSDAAGRQELHVQDDGPGITPEVRAHLFEPFYTTSSKGTGLGLYLARELCLNNNATLDYEYRFDGQAFGIPKPTGRFVITFARPMAV